MRESEFSCQVMPAREWCPDGFNFTAHMGSLCADITTRMPELAHVDMGQVAICCSQARKRVHHGLQAALTPMRFENGGRFTIQNGRRYTSQRLADPTTGREFLYILTFYLPRFINASRNEKLVTVFHELWHISPDFNGDLRRHAGRCYIHTGSQRQYDARMQQLANRWLSLSPPCRVHAFLDFDFRRLQRRYGRIFGLKIPHPKLIPVP